MPSPYPDPAGAGSYHIFHNSGPLYSFSIRSVHWTQAHSGKRKDILSKFHRNVAIMYGVLALGLLLSFIGGLMVLSNPAVLIVGLILVFGSILFGFFSGAVFCPLCGELISRQGFGEYCKHCGGKIF